MNMDTSFLLIPAGSVIERVYFALPTWYDLGDEFDTLTEALEAAVARAGEYPERSITIDLRWKIATPDGVGSDFVAQRETFPNLDAAKKALAQRKRYSDDTPPTSDPKPDAEENPIRDAVGAEFYDHFIGALPTEVKDAASTLFGALGKIIRDAGDRR